MQQSRSRLRAVHDRRLFAASRDVGRDLSKTRDFLAKYQPRSFAGSSTVTYGLQGDCVPGATTAAECRAVRIDAATARYGNFRRLAFATSDNGRLRRITDRSSLARVGPRSGIARRADRAATARPKSASLLQFARRSRGAKAAIRWPAMLPSATKPSWFTPGSASPAACTPRCAAKTRPTASHSSARRARLQLVGGGDGARRRTRDALEVAALLHDVGKIGVPDKVLLKPGRLTPEEAESMARHTAMTIEILASCGAPQHVLDIVHYAARWFDGDGRPARSPGDDLAAGRRECCRSSTPSTR